MFVRTRTEARWKHVVAIAGAAVLLACSGSWPAFPTAFAAEPRVTAPIAAQAAAPTRAADANQQASHARPLDKPSAAQYVARLERAIDADRKQLDALVCQQDDPQSEYSRAKADFERLDGRRADLREKIDELKRLGQSRQATDLQDQFESLAPQWQAARKRFDLAIQVRKTLRDKVASLQEKIARDSKTLASLTMPPLEELFDAAMPPPPARGERQGAGLAGADGPLELPRPSVTPPHTTPAAGAVAAALGSVTSSRVPNNARLLKAREDAQAKLAAARQADEKARSATGRFEALQKNIAIEQQLLALARAEAEQAHQAWAALNDEVQPKLASDPAGLVDLTKKIADAAERSTAAQQSAKSSQDRLDDLRDQLADVQQEKIAALHEADNKLTQAYAAQGAVERLQNPFTPTNILQWLLDHGPNLLAILLGTLALNLAVKLSGRHLVRVMARSSMRGTLRERENRALTLVGVFRNVVSLTIVVGGMLMALDEVGIPILPLMGGAAVLGLAVAFGAQNLVRDYFSGFMVLLEDQYGINDVVKIGDIAGAVEQITLRITVLRDLEGVVHFIPHGSITRVSNMTHSWSRALVEISVGYKEDTDRVMDVMLEVASQLRKDPVFGPLTLDDPEMLGVNSFNEASVTIKMCVKTHPLKRWQVRRELLRRIKHRFDEVGIDIPPPKKPAVLRDPAPRPDLPEMRGAA